MADSTRAGIKTKIRMKTRSPREAQITDVQLNNYISTVLQDFPLLLHLFSNTKTFSFFTTPNIDRYSTNLLNSDDPMYDFKNAVITTQTPIYCAGYQLQYFQSRTQFFNIWNQRQSRFQIATGDGVTTNFTGTLSSIPVTPRSILFTSKDSTGLGQQLTDVPLVSALAGQEGSELINGNLYDPRGVVPTEPTVVIATNTINYVTGVYDVTFTVAPASGEIVNVQTVPYRASRPTAILFFDNTFTIRNIPDESYEIKIEAEVPPAELTDDSSRPGLDQWFQFITIAASKKIFEDRTDFASVQEIMPEYEEQMLLIERRTLDQLKNERVPTIYSVPRGFGYRGIRWRNLG